MKSLHAWFGKNFYDIYNRSWWQRWKDKYNSVLYVESYRVSKYTGARYDVEVSRITDTDAITPFDCFGFGWYSFDNYYDKRNLRWRILIDCTGGGNESRCQRIPLAKIK